MRPAGLFGRLRRDAHGSVAIIAATFGMGMVAALALAIDVSSVYLARRQQQSALDLAALAAARSLSTAGDSARAALISNGVADVDSLQVTLGRYDPDGGRNADGRFVADQKPYNAVRLDLKRAAPVYFGRKLLGGALPQLASRSVAANTRIAAFVIGTRLASLDGGLANGMLSALLGANVSLSLNDYDALASANIDMPDLLRVLPVRVGVTAASYDDVIALRPTIGQFAGAIADASTGTSAARQALARLASAGSTRRVPMSQLVSMGPFGKLPLGRSTGLSATVSALDVLFTGVGVANGSSQVAVDLGLQVPGLLGLTATLDIGERPQGSPWLAMGAESASVRTAQTRLRIVASATAPLGLVALKVPVAVDAAAAVGTLTYARCGANPRLDAQAKLDVTPTLIEAWVGEPKRADDWANLALPADMGPGVLLDSLLVRATASAHVVATSVRPTTLSFSAADIGKRTLKTVQTSDIAQTSLTSLVGGLDVTATLKPLGVTLGTPTLVSTTLQATVRPLGATLDPVVNAALRLVGVSLGEADVAVTGLRCDGSALVM